MHRTTELDGAAGLAPETFQAGKGLAGLVIALAAQSIHDADHRLRWSHWRRRHQARSRASHYHRQAAHSA